MALLGGEGASQELEANWIERLVRAKRWEAALYLAGRREALAAERGRGPSHAAACLLALEAARTGAPDAKSRAAALALGRDEPLAAALAQLEGLSADTTEALWLLLDGLTYRAPVEGAPPEWQELLTRFGPARPALERALGRALAGVPWPDLERDFEEARGLEPGGAVEIARELLALQRGVAPEACVPRAAWSEPAPAPWDHAGWVAYLGTARRGGGPSDLAAATETRDPALANEAVAQGLPASEAQRRLLRAARGEHSFAAARRALAAGGSERARLRRLDEIVRQGGGVHADLLASRWVAALRMLRAELPDHAVALGVSGTWREWVGACDGPRWLLRVLQLALQVHPPLTACDAELLEVACSRWPRETLLQAMAVSAWAKSGRSSEALRAQRRALARGVPLEHLRQLRLPPPTPAELARLAEEWPAPPDPETRWGLPWAEVGSGWRGRSLWEAYQRVAGARAESPREELERELVRLDLLHELGAFSQASALASRLVASRELVGVPRAEALLLGADAGARLEPRDPSELARLEASLAEAQDLAPADSPLRATVTCSLAKLRGQGSQALIELFPAQLEHPLGAELWAAETFLRGDLARFEQGAQARERMRPGFPRTWLSEVRLALLRRQAQPALLPGLDLAWAEGCEELGLVDYLLIRARQQGPSHEAILSATRLASGGRQTTQALLILAQESIQSLAGLSPADWRWARVQRWARLLAVRPPQEVSQAMSTVRVPPAGQMALWRAGLSLPPCGASALPPEWARRAAPLGPAGAALAEAVLIAMRGGDSARQEACLERARSWAADAEPLWRCQALLGYARGDLALVQRALPALRELRGPEDPWVRFLGMDEALRRDRAWIEGPAQVEVEDPDLRLELRVFSTRATSEAAPHSLAVDEELRALLAERDSARRIAGWDRLLAPIGRLHAVFLSTRTLDLVRALRCQDALRLEVVLSDVRQALVDEGPVGLLVADAARSGDVPLELGLADLERAWRRTGRAELAVGLAVLSLSKGGREERERALDVLEALRRQHPRAGIPAEVWGEFGPEHAERVNALRRGGQ